MIRLRDITKVYHLGEIDLQVLKGITLDINEGEFVSLTGASGSGKSTLMNILGCLDRPTSGHYYIAGEDVAKFNAAERATLRNKRIGFVFQNFNLLSRTTALENVMMPAVYAHPALSMKAMRERSVELLNLVGLSDRMDHTPAQLSGGQQQRVALARILCTRPEAILLDEPFSALDSFLKWKLELELSDLLADFHGPILWVSHDRGEVFRNCKKVCVVEQGQSQGMFTLRQLFHEPETEAAARLSGCKNIVEAVPAGNAVTLPQWGLTLDCGKAVPADVRWAGIRAHHVTAAPEGTEGAFLCAVERVIQDVFTTIVLLRPEGAASGAPLLRMELEREDAPTVLDNQLVWISVQPRDILLLK